MILRKLSPADNCGSGQLGRSSAFFGKCLKTITFIDNVPRMVEVSCTAGSMTPNALLIMMLFGAVGMGYFVYGKNQRRAVPLISGILLCVYPYFVSGIVPLILVGALLVAVPCFVKT
jgi:hypothetical protein